MTDVQRSLIEANVDLIDNEVRMLCPRRDLWYWDELVSVGHETLVRSALHPAMRPVNFKGFAARRLRWDMLGWIKKLVRQRDLARKAFGGGIRWRDPRSCRRFGVEPSYLP